MIAFTGSQEGMTNAQNFKLATVLNVLRAVDDSFIHGDCIGCDALAHDIAAHFDYRIYIRPCTIRSKRAFRKDKVFHLYTPEDPMKRNTKIVEDGRMLVATPRQFKEVTKSGTWATIRRARRIGRPILYIWPDGSVNVENIPFFLEVK